MTELWLVHKCEHGVNPGAWVCEAEGCEGGSVEVLDPERVVIEFDPVYQTMRETWTVRDILDALAEGKY